MAYLDSEFSSLPDGWTSKELQDVVEIHNTKRQPLNGREREGRKGGFPYCGANGVVDYIDDYRFDGEYVLIAEDGGYWGKHQPSSYIMRGKFWVNNHAHVVCAKDGETTNVFFSQILNYLNIDPFIGGDARGKLTKAILTQLAIPLPPLPEQKKIAHILSTVQRSIEAQERIIQTTTELKKALMHKLFTEGLRHEPQKQTEIGPVPESWEVVRIKATGTVVTGSTPSTKNPDFYGGDYNLISPADLDNGKYVRSAHKTLTKAGFEECRSVPRDSVLVGCIGNVGKLGMVADDCSTTNQQINSIIPNSGFSPHFLYYALQLCRPRLEQAAAKVTLPILNKSNFENFQIAAPERNEQEAIAGYLGIVDQKLENAGQKTAQLQDLFRTLLHELMTAKTRVYELAV
jgi:type I restriction enzyme S subunit